MHFVIFGILALLYVGRGSCKRQEGVSLSPFQYPIRRLIVRSREVSKPRDWEFKLSHRFDILQAHRQQCCQGACQILERSVKTKYKKGGLDTSWGVTSYRISKQGPGIYREFLIKRNAIFDTKLPDSQSRTPRIQISGLGYPFVFAIMNHIRCIILDRFKPYLLSPTNS